MEKYQSLIVNAKDIRIVNASDPTGFDDINTGDAASTIKVYDAGTLDVSAIFSDDGVTPLSNPFNADADGVFFFYAANGNYDVIVNESLVTESKDISVTLFDPSEADYATSAQGAKADSALQPGDNVSELINDANYIKADSVSLINLDSPLFQGFQPNKLTTVSAPSGTDSDVTHTRASTATYIDRYGVLKTAGIDELRETADGYQIEAVGSTNSLLWSEDITNVAWVKFNLSISADSTTSPDGLGQVNRNDPTSNDGSFRQFKSSVAGDVFSGSIYLKSDSVDIDTTLRLVDNTDGFISTENITITSSWNRFEVKGVAIDERVGLLLGGGATWRIGENLYAWGAQLEEGNLSSYIPTTDAPATRAPDIVSMTYENNVPRGDQPYTIIFKGIVDGYTNFNRLFGAESNATSDRITSFINSSGNIFYTNGGDNSQVRTDNITFGEEFTYIVTSDGINYASYLDGVLQATSIVTSPATELPNEMRILQGDNIGNNSNGKVSLFKTLPYAITADEAKLIS